MAALTSLCVLCRSGGRKLSICSTNRTKLRLPLSNTRVSARPRAKVSVTIKDMSDIYHFFHFVRVMWLLLFWISYCSCCRNRNRDCVTDQSAHHSVPFPCKSPRCWSHRRSGTPTAPRRVSVTDWPSAAGDRGKWSCARIEIPYSHDKFPAKIIIQIKKFLLPV